MFIFADPQEISGPDGPGSDLPLIGWQGSESTGNYRVLLEGVAFLGLQFACVSDLNGDGSVGGADLGILLAAWGGCNPGVWCPADFDGDGKVNGQDLGVLLGEWGPCPLVGTPCGDPRAGSCAEANGTPGCSDPCCCTHVCMILPSCCDLGWDGACAQVALMVCQSP